MTFAALPGTLPPPLPMTRPAMRHILRLFLLFLALQLAACGGAELPLGATPTPTPADTPTPTPTPTPVLPGAYGGLARILQRGVLIVGFPGDADPLFVSRDAQGTVQGVDVQLADAIARRWLGRPNTLAWTFDATVADLLAGRVDLLMGGLPHTRALEAEIDFSQTYWQQEETPIAIGLPPSDSLLADAVNATLQALVAEGVWDEVVRSAAAPATFSPQRWPGPLPTLAELAAASQPPGPSRLSPDRSLTIAYLLTPDFVTVGNDTAGYLPDLARALGRRLTGDDAITLAPLTEPPPLDFATFDLYLGPQQRNWPMELQADFSQDFYGDGLALVARPGSKVEGIAQLDSRPTALVETPNSRLLYDQAIAAAAVTPRLFAVADADAAIAMLADNKVDAVLIQGYPAARRLAARVPAAILTPGRHGPIQPFAVALPANDSPLRDAVNLALQDMRTDDTLAQLHSRYFGGDPPYPITIWPHR